MSLWKTKNDWVFANTSVKKKLKQVAQKVVGFLQQWKKITKTEKGEDGGAHCDDEGRLETLVEPNNAMDILLVSGYNNNHLYLYKIITINSLVYFLFLFGWKITPRTTWSRSNIL